MNATVLPPSDSMPGRSIELMAPSATFADSYRSLVTEFTVAGEAPVPFVIGFEHRDIDALLARLADCSRGVGLPEGFVPHSTYWLVRDGAEVVGVSNLRHGLTPRLHREGGNIGYGIRPGARRRGLGREILRQTLQRARELGLGRALLTCGKANEASARIIVANGGTLDSEEWLPDRGEIVQRYWIAVA